MSEHCPTCEQQHRCPAVVTEPDDKYREGGDYRCALWLGHGGWHTDAAHISWGDDEDADE